jgi:hypothetical protein
LRRIAKDIVDEHGEPFFRDIEPELYLAAAYTAVDQAKLKPLGLTVIDMKEFIARFKADLNRSDSRYKATTTTREWHARLAISLVSWLQKNVSVQEIRSLPIVPVQGGQWVGASRRQIYYPDCQGIRVPLDISLDVIDSAVCDTDRNRLWEKLGVQNLSPSDGLQKILDRYRASRPISLDESIIHLRFIFGT